MGRRLDGSPAFVVAKVEGGVTEVAVSGSTAAWIVSAGGSQSIVTRELPDEPADPHAQDAASSQRGADQVLLLLLVELWLLNVADLALTRYHGMWLGFATESNGIMDFFLRAGTVPALAFKVGIVTVGALFLWRLRVYRISTVAAALVAGVFAAVVAYQVLWVLSLRA